MRKALLICGILSTLLYAATDLVGGLSYSGYRFASQAVSELMATGAPSEPIVDPLFLAYGALVVAFGIGVLRVAGERRILRVVALLVIAYAVIGLTGPTQYEMHPRGTATLADDMPHIVLTAVLVVLTVAWTAIAAFAFGPRFRLYSFATLAVMFVLGALSSADAANLAANQPTPWLGIRERITIYAAQLWMAVFALTLLRAPQPSVAPMRERA